MRVSNFAVFMKIIRNVLSGRFSVAAFQQSLEDSVEAALKNTELSIDIFVVYVKAVNADVKVSQEDSAAINKYTTETLASINSLREVILECRPEYRAECIIRLDAMAKRLNDHPLKQQQPIS